MLKRLAVLLASAALIAGCGSTALTARAPAGSARSVASHACDPGDYFMQCALPAVGLGIGPQTSGASAYGIDFGWSSVSAARAKTLGAKWAFSYLSLDSSKNWTPALVSAYHAAGIATIAVWETWANRAQDGYGAGVADAKAARAQAGNATRAIPFAVDCPCAPSSVLAYFQGAHSVLGSRTDAYGDYAVILYLYQHHVVGNDNSQTYAWSGGRWLPSSIAPIEQYLNGSAFDNDRALTRDFGQSPAPAPPAPVCFHRRESATKCAAAKAQVASDQRAAAASARMLTIVDGRLTRHACVRPYRRATCVRSGALARTFSHRVVWFDAAAQAIERAN